VIRSWKNASSRKVWDGKRPNQFRGLDFDVALDLLLALNVAKTLRDLSALDFTSSRANGRANGP
jgi:proteic killer suppression protein